MADDEQQHSEEEEEKKEAEERSSPSGSVVYKAICHEGSSELERSSSALAWSGLAAGLSMGFSFFGTALIHAHLPHAKWTPLVSALGYTLGFLIVVLGRQQLFTENTLTVILPLLTERKPSMFANVLRLWTMVLVSNVIGAILFALVLAKTEVVDAETWEALRTVAKESHSAGFAVSLLRGVFAGWLIALMVWLLPFAESARVLVIVILTWVVGAAHFTHVIVGSVEGAFLAFTGDVSWGAFLGTFFLPALLGNIAGGVALVAAINHAQVVAGEHGTDA
jgi:formate/nitrite transporter FocA (FNT family)